MIHRKATKLVMDQLIGVNIRPVELEVYTKCVQTDLTLEGKYGNVMIQWYDYCDVRV